MIHLPQRLQRSGYTPYRVQGASVGGHTVSRPPRTIATGTRPDVSVGEVCQRTQKLLTVGIILRVGLTYSGWAYSSGWAYTQGGLTLNISRVGLYSIYSGWAYTQYIQGGLILNIFRVGLHSIYPGWAYTQYIQGGLILNIFRVGLYSIYSGWAYTQGGPIFRVGLTQVGLYLIPKG